MSDTPRLLFLLDPYIKLGARGLEASSLSAPLLYSYYAL